MKIVPKVLMIVGIVFVLLIAVVIFRVAKEQSDRALDQQSMAKSDEELIGEHFYVPRVGKEAVDVNLYIPETDEKIPIGATSYLQKKFPELAGDQEKAAQILLAWMDNCGKDGNEP